MNPWLIAYIVSVPLTYLAVRSLDRSVYPYSRWTVLDRFIVALLSFLSPLMLFMVGILYLALVVDWNKEAKW
jgi:hypothetical protein